MFVFKGFKFVFHRLYVSAKTPVCCLKQNKSADGGCSVVDLLEKNQSLEIEVTVLRQKLVETATTMQPTDAVLQQLSSSKVVTTSDLEVTAGTEQKNELVEYGEDGRLLAVSAMTQPTDATLQRLRSSSIAPKVVSNSDHEATVGIDQKNEVNEGRLLAVDVTEKTVGMNHEEVVEGRTIDAVLPLLNCTSTAPMIVTTSDREITLSGTERKDDMAEDEDGRLPAVDVTEEITDGTELTNKPVEDEAGGLLAVKDAVRVDPEEVAERCEIVETAVDGGSEGTIDLDEEDMEQVGMMTCSLSSTTSGFDDNSLSLIHI